MADTLQEKKKKKKLHSNAKYEGWVYLPFGIGKAG